MKVLWMILSVLIVATPALAADVNYKFDTKANFSGFKTYRWEKHPQSLEIDPVTLSKLGAAFDAELAKKGLTRTESSAADIVIVYQIGLRVDQEITTFAAGWSTGPPYSPYWTTSWSTSGGAGATSNSSTNIIPVGSIDLDIYESARKELVWRGMITKSMEPGVSPEKQQKNIADIAAKLMKNYPPKTKKK